MTIPFLTLIFWICLGAGVYHYIGYPIILFILAQLSQAKSDVLYLLFRRSRRCKATPDYLPLVAVLVSAYNEESVIAEKAVNTLQLDYPEDKLESLFGLDAPSDFTAERMAAVHSDRIHLFRFDIRRGKLAVLRDLAQRTSAEILVLTDANTMLDRNCIRNLVRHFADPTVGAVSGEEVRVVAPEAGPTGESHYWRYESALKLMESRLNCTVGGNGAVLAVRRSLFHPQKDSIVEDFQVPLEIRFAGYRVVYDPEAVATEEIAPTFSAQFARRVRIGAGNYQTLFQNPKYLNPSKGLLSLAFFSHRVLRWLIPILMVLAFCASIILAGQPEFTGWLVVQCLLYSMAACGFWLRKSNKCPRLFAMALCFCSMNLALMFGLIRFLRGRQALLWNSTPRAKTKVFLHDSPSGN